MIITSKKKLEEVVPDNQELLNNGLTILSIEKKLLKQIDYKTIINDFAS